MTPEQNRWLASLYEQSRNGNRAHKHIEGAIAISAAELQKVFGEKYLSQLWFIDCVNDRYWVDHNERKNSYTRAYKINELGMEYIRTELPKAIQPPKVFQEGYRDEPINLQKLEELLKDPTNFKEPEDMLMTQLFWSNVDKQTGINWTKYRRCGGKYGRRFAAGPSLQGLPKYVRFQIIENMTDVDMVNAHPTLIKAFAEREGADATNIADYKSNREEWLKDISEHYGVDRKAAKTLMLALSYGCSLTSVRTEAAYLTWINENKAKTAQPLARLTEYSNELGSIMNTVLSTDDVKAKGFNRIRKQTRAFALFIQSIEDELLSVCDVVLKRHGRYANVLMFDGFMVVGTVSNELVHEMESCMNKYLRVKYNVDCQMKLNSNYYHWIK